MGYATKKTEPRSAGRQASVVALTGLPQKNAADVAQALNALLADVFALYVKTKNFHWHVSGPHFRDYHLLLDQQATQILAMVDPIAERVRKLGRPTLKSIGDIGRLQRVRDNEADDVEPQAMLAELLDDNKMLASRLRETRAAGRRCHRQPDRGVDRRDRGARLVPVRDGEAPRLKPAGRRKRIAAPRAA